MLTCMEFASQEAYSALDATPIHSTISVVREAE